MRMMDVLHNLVWMDEKLKNRYRNFLENLVHDSIWNAKNILSKYAKTHWVGDEAFKDAILRTKLFA
jgi:hypothetical protein